MSTQEPKRQRIMLTEEGELQPLNTTISEPRTESVFCPQCGTANRSTHRYCRNCGQSLDDLDDGDIGYRAAGPKLKREMMQQFVPQYVSQPKQSLTFLEAALEVFTLLVVMGMVFAVTLPYRGETWLVVPILIAWAAIEAARHGRKR